MNMADQARAEPTGESSGQAAVIQQAADKIAQAAAPRAAPAPQAESGAGRYLDAALGFISVTASATKLREWWKRERQAREAAQLSAEQTDRLFGAYEERLGKLTGV